LKLILPFLMLLSLQSYGSQTSETFIIKMFEEKVRVLAPQKYSSKLGVTIENKTLSSLMGKIETQSGKRLAIVNIQPNGFKVVDLNNIPKNQKLFFVPMAPAFQSVELKFGRSSYEIPPKR